MNGRQHREQAENAIWAALDHRESWSKLTPGTDEADAALDMSLWELRRAEVHARLAALPDLPPAPGPPRPVPGPPIPGPRRRTP